MLTPIYDNDITITPELEQKIEEARKQYKNRETIVCKNAEEAIEFLKSLWAIREFASDVKKVPKPFLPGMKSMP